MTQPITPLVAPDDLPHTTALNSAVLTNPYVGPRTFTIEQAAIFFGREREARDLLALVVANRVVLFFAQSGAGKSSLINTRLIPSLQFKGFEVFPVGRIGGELSAGQQVTNIFTHNLMMTLAENHIDAHRLAEQSLSDFLTSLALVDGRWVYGSEADTEPEAEYEVSDFPTTRSQATDSISGGMSNSDALASEDPPLAPRVLIIDQFEELLTTHPDQWAKREAFFSDLNHALTDDPFLWLVLTLREDYVAALSPFAHLLPGGLRARYYMQRMEADAALEAVAQPAALGGRPFAPGVAQVLVDNLRQVRSMGQEQTQLGQFVEPVQLQVVCYQLWEKLHASPLEPIQLADLTRCGDVDRALAEYYEETLAAVLANPQCPCSARELRTWFDQKLITVNGLRNFVLQEATTTAGMANCVVRQLQDRFLLHGENRSGGLWVELVHDRFVQPIQEANRAWLLAQNNPVTVAARLWRENNHDPERLLRGANLSDAQQYATAHPDELGDEEYSFLTASAHQQELELEAARKRTLELAQAEAEKERHNSARLRYFVRSLIGLALISLLATGFAMFQYREANLLKNQLRVDQIALVARSVGIESNLPQRGLLLAVEAATRIIPARSAAQQTLHSLLSQTGGQLRAGHTAAVLSVAFSPDGKLLASGSADDTIRVWQANEANTAPLILRGHTAAVLSVAFSPDGKLLASGSEDNTIRVWQVNEANTEPLILRGHEAAVWSVAFSPDGKLLASGSWDNTIRVWPVNEANTEPTFLRGHTSVVHSVAFSPDGKLLASGSADDTIRVWQVNEANTEPTILRGHTDAILSVAFSPDGKLLASGSWDNTIRVWQVNEANTQPTILRGHEAVVMSVAFSPDGKLLASGSADDTIRVWQVNEANAQPTILRGHTASVHSVAFSPDGKLLATAGWDNTIRVWPVNEANAQSTILRGHTDVVNSVAFSPDGKLLASGSNDNTIRVWQVNEVNIEPTILRGHTAAVNSVAFSPDGKLLASGSNDNTIRVWQVNEANTEPTILRGHIDAVNFVAFSPTGKQLASGSNDDMIRVWQVNEANAHPTFMLGHTVAVNSVAFSPDGKLLAIGSWDNTIRVWQVNEANTQPTILLGHTAIVISVAFSPDGKLLASASADNTIRVWPVNETNTEPTILRGHTAAVKSVAFSPDSKLLASGSEDMRVHLWYVQVEDSVTLACKIAGRNLTTAEWDQYFPGEAYKRTCPMWPFGVGIGNYNRPTPPFPPIPTTVTVTVEQQ